MHRRRSLTRTARAGRRVRHLDLPLRKGRANPTRLICGYRLFACPAPAGLGARRCGQAPPRSGPGAKPVRRLERLCKPTWRSCSARAWRQPASTSARGLRFGKSVALVRNRPLGEGNDLVEARVLNWERRRAVKSISCAWSASRASRSRASGAEVSVSSATSSQCSSSSQGWLSSVWISRASRGGACSACARKLVDWRLTAPLGLPIWALLAECARRARARASRARCCCGARRRRPPLRGPWPRAISRTTVRFRCPQGLAQLALVLVAHAASAMRATRALSRASRRRAARA